MATPIPLVQNPRSAVNPIIFDENQSKYKCCCSCMTVRSGAAVIATLKALGVLVAIFELFTGPHFFANFPINGRSTSKAIIRTTTMDPWVAGFDLDEMTATTIATNFGYVDGSEESSSTNNNNFNAFRFSSTLVYLLVEAVAVSCLFYALRRQRPKFVIPEMAVILVCMSFELIIALLVVVGASFGSESLVQMVVERLREQGESVTNGDVEQIRRLMPFILTVLAFGFIIGAAFEFWFFRVLKGYYRYLQDKLAFRTYNGLECVDIVRGRQQQGGPAGAAYVNGYQPMVEESTADELQKKDMPPAYQEIIQQENENAMANAAMVPPPYKEFTTQ